MSTHDPFAALKSQIDWSTHSSGAGTSRRASAAREKNMTSSDPHKRFSARGTIPGVGLSIAEKKRDAEHTAKITGVNCGYARN